VPTGSEVHTRRLRKQYKKVVNILI
jgi:hypothetical protein